MNNFLKSKAGWSLILAVIISLSWLPGKDLASDEKLPAALKAGQEKAGSWWMKQTAMSADGRLIKLPDKKVVEKCPEFKSRRKLPDPGKGED